MLIHWLLFELAAGTAHSYQIPPKFNHYISALHTGEPRAGGHNGTGSQWHADSLPGPLAYARPKPMAPLANIINIIIINIIIFFTADGLGSGVHGGII